MYTPSYIGRSRKSPPPAPRQIGPVHEETVINQTQTVSIFISSPIAGMVFPSVDVFGGRDYPLLFFAVATMGCMLLIIRAIVVGSSPVQIILLGGLTLYALVLTLERLGEAGDLKRVLTIPLGILGMGALINGHTTDLPVLFIILGVGGFLDLAWSRFDGFQ